MSLKEKYGVGMQITKNWRLNSLRYRLEGVRYINGEVKLQARPVMPENKSKSTSLFSK